MHSTRPVVDVNVPLGQIGHVIKPEVAPYEPVAHGGQTVDP